MKSRTTRTKTQRRPGVARTVRCTTTIGLVGVNPFVDLPARVSAFFGLRGYVPVKVHLDRGEVASTLVPIGGGLHRLYINAIMLRHTDARVGKRIALGLEYDARDRTLKTPRDISARLREHPDARRRWDGLSPSRRKEIIRYISFAKTAETRKRNIGKLMGMLGSAEGGSLSGIRIGGRKR